MSYRIRGRVGNEEIVIEWDDGHLSGDALTVTLLKIRAQAHEGTPVGPPTGPWTHYDHLRDPLSALFLMRDFLGDNIEGEGDLPEPEALPGDAVS